MHISQIKGRVLDYLMAAVVDHGDGRRPEPWQPTQSWPQVVSFWAAPGSMVERVEPRISLTRPDVTGTVGQGIYLARYKGYLAKGDTPLEAICRVMVLEAFGQDIDVPGDVR